MDPGLIQVFIAVITVICSGFGAFLGVKIAIVKLETEMAAMEKRHYDQCNFVDRRISRLEEVQERLVEAGIEKPCKSNEDRIRVLENFMHSVKSELSKSKREGGQ